MDTNTLKQRVKKFLSTERISSTEFAKLAGVSPAYTNSIKKNISIDIMQKLVEINPAVNLSWLLFGIGAMYNNDNTRIAQLQKDNQELSDKVSLLQKVITLYERNENAKK